MKQDLSIIDKNTAEEKGQMQKNLNREISAKTVKLIAVCIGLAVLGLITFSIFQLKNLSTEYSLEQFFPLNHPLLVQAKSVKSKFQLEERSSFLLVLEWPEAEKHTWLEKQSMKSLSDLTHEIQSLSQVQSALSIATLEGAQNVDQNLVIGPLFDHVEVAKWPQLTKSNELIHSQMISDNFKSVMISVQPKKLDPKSLSELTTQLTGMALQKFPPIQIKVGGAPAIQGSLSVKLMKDLKKFLLLSVVAFCLVFFLFFRGVSSIVLTLGSLVFVNVVIIGGLAFFRVPFSVLLSTLPIIVSISLISVVIHTMHRWAELLDRSNNRAQKYSLALKVIREMLIPNFLGSLTTAIGFVTLCVTDIGLIRQYGYVVAISVVASWLLTQFVLLGFMHFTSPQLRSWTHGKAYWGLTVLRKPRWVVGAIFVLVFVMFGLGQRVSFSGRLFDDLPSSDLNRQATEAIDTRFGGAVPYDIVLYSAEKDYWKQPGPLQRLYQVNSYLRKEPQVGSLLTAADFLGRPLPTSSQSIAETLFLFSMSDNNPLKNFITEDGRSIRLSVRMHDLDSQKIEQARLRIKSYLQQIFPSVGVYESGFAVTSHTINQEVSKGLVFNFWHSILLVGLLLVVFFKSLRWAIVACLPNLIPPAILIGCLGLWQTPIKPGVALIFSISMGLAFNNTIYFLSRLKRMRFESSRFGLPVKRALLQEGNPCLFETFVMFFGFAIFLSSGFKLNQIFGIYMIITILAGALGDLIFLPALLRLVPSFLNHKKLKFDLKSLQKGENLVEEFPQQQSQVTRKVACYILGAGLGIGILFTPGSVQAAKELSASEWLKKAQGLIEAKDDQAVVKMKIIEANSELKLRTLKIQTLRDKKYRALVRIQAPADIKGTGLLVEVSKDHEDQWIYLPSTKQVRRVVGPKKSTGVLGSELTLEDLNSTAIRSSAVKVYKKGPQFTIVEILPKSGTSIYDQVLVSLATQSGLPLRTDYLLKGQVRKVVQFSNYKKVGSVWRSQLVQVKNLVNKRGTDLEFSEIKTNSGLGSDDFSLNALKPD